MVSFRGGRRGTSSNSFNFGAGRGTLDALVYGSSMAWDQFDVIGSDICVVIGASGLLDGTMVAVSTFLGNDYGRFVVDIIAEQFYRLGCYCIDICIVVPSVLESSATDCETVLS